MSTLTFTVALPVRNGGTHLKQCVRSILDQSWGAFEVVVLDNASDDGSSEWLTSLTDKRVTILRSDRLLSIEENWARIRDIPKHEFLTLLGHDDILDPNFLSVIALLIAQHPDAGLYLTHFRLIGSDGKVLRRCRPLPRCETAAEFLAMRLCNQRESFGTGHVLRSSVYDAVGGIPLYPKLLFADDALFLKAIHGSYRATAFEETFSYRWHSASTASAAAMGDFFRALQAYSEFLLQAANRDQAIAQVLERYFGEYALELGELYYREQLTQALEGHGNGNSDAREQAIALASQFTSAPPRWTPKRFTLLLERARSSPIHRVIYQAWHARNLLRRAGQWGRQMVLSGEPPQRLRSRPQL